MDMSLLTVKQQTVCMNKLIHGVSSGMRLPRRKLLAMTNGGVYPCHCEERSDVAISCAHPKAPPYSGVQGSCIVYETVFKLCIHFFFRKTATEIAKRTHSSNERRKYT